MTSDIADRVTRTAARHVLQADTTTAQMQALCFTSDDMYRELCVTGDRASPECQLHVWLQRVLPARRAEV